MPAIRHIGITAEDPAAVGQFYQDVFGFIKVSSGDESAVPEPPAPAKERRKTRRIKRCTGLCCSRAPTETPAPVPVSYKAVLSGALDYDQVSGALYSPTSSTPSSASSTAGLNPLEVVFPEEFLGAATVEEEFITFEVILDSGAGAHVVSSKMIPGYSVLESALSRAGAGFVAADGGRMDNLGEALLHLVTLDSRGGEHNVHSTFQVADVTRALWSVGLICDSGLKVEFGQTMAVIKDAQGVEICVFRRVNGLYVAKAKLRNPLFKGFQRPGE